METGGANPDASTFSVGWFFRSLARKSLCVFYGLSVIGALLIYGLWQERIMSLAYEGEYFTVSVFLVVFNRIFGIVFALPMIFLMIESFKCQAPLWKYIFISVSTVVASICQYEALKYVSFTVQILGKSFKMMPVMLWGMYIFGRKYRYVDWFVALGVTAGVVWFLLSGPFAPAHKNGNSAYGILLLVAFIFLDGFTATFQEQLFRENNTSKYNQMLYINLCSAIISIVILFVSGYTSEVFHFSFDHPSLYGDASILSAAAVLAQWFIYSQVQDFGALAFAATMNVRQVASVLASYIAYSHSITVMQILGLVIVFVSLALQSTVSFVAEVGERTPMVKKPEEATSKTVIRFKKTTMAHCCPSLSDV